MGAKYTYILDSDRKSKLFRYISVIDKEDSEKATMLLASIVELNDRDIDVIAYPSNFFCPPQIKCIYICICFQQLQNVILLILILFN